MIIFIVGSNSTVATDHVLSKNIKLIILLLPEFVLNISEFVGLLNLTVFLFFERQNNKLNSFKICLYYYYYFYRFTIHLKYTYNDIYSFKPDLMFK